jgi:hypothetical protein
MPKSMKQSDRRIKKLTRELEALLRADVAETALKKNENWQAEKARKICERLLDAAKADGMHGCELCQG